MAVLGRGPIPFYHQIIGILRDKVTKGELIAGDRLPSEEQLQRTFGVSRATVRQALQALERENLIERRRGKGSYVSTPKNAIAEVKMTCLIEDLIALGIPGRNVVSDVEVVSAGRAIAEAMHLPRGDRVFTFSALGNGERYALCVASGPFCAGLSAGKGSRQSPLATDVRRKVRP